jgi:hypothetical protein
MKHAAPIALISAIFVIAAVPAEAQATRTWVSGVGADGNTCSRTAPCATFAGAISKTAAGGEINCLDPGNFAAVTGAVTITQSIIIDCEAASNGSVLPSSGNAIVITAGTVTLRGLDINGLGGSATGVSIAGGATVNIQNSKIYGFTTAGVSLASGAALVLTNTRITNNAAGVLASGNIVLRDDVIDDNSGNGITVQAGINALVDRTTLTFNGGTGLSVSGGAVVLLGNSTITGNATGVSNSASTLYSFRQNQVAGNTTDGTPIAAFPGPGGPLQ